MKLKANYLHRARAEKRLPITAAEQRQHYCFVLSMSISFYGNQGYRCFFKGGNSHLILGPRFSGYLRKDGESFLGSVDPQMSHPKQDTYAAYAWVVVYGQRKLDLQHELPDEAPEGFFQLRNLLFDR